MECGDGAPVGSERLSSFFLHHSLIGQTAPMRSECCVEHAAESRFEVEGTG